MINSQTYYKRIHKLGIPVQREPFLHVRWDDLYKALGDKKDKFNELFGARTCLLDGPYAHSVEMVLEMMESN